LVNLNNLNIQQLHIFDYNGRLVLSPNLDSNTSSKTVDLSRLKTSTYFMVISTRKGQKIIRLIKE